MKVKTSIKKIKEYYTTIGIGYCDAYYLLSGLNANYYTSGIYGWNNDIYIIDNKIAIITGYRNINAKYYPKSETLTKYENKAKELYQNYDCKKYNYNYDMLYKKIEKLRNKFISEVLESE